MTGFIERASCDIYCITDVGRVKSKDKPTAFNSALEAFTLGRIGLNDDVKISAEEAMQVGLPQEEIENNYKLLNGQLGDYLIKGNCGKKLDRSNRSERRLHCIQTRIRCSA